MKLHNLPIWHDKVGQKIACTEKLKVMQQNIQELAQIAQDAFEDGVLMGIEPNQLQNYFVNIMQHLNNPYKDKNV